MISQPVCTHSQSHSDHMQRSAQLDRPGRKRMRAISKSKLNWKYPKRQCKRKINVCPTWELNVQRHEQHCIQPTMFAIMFNRMFDGRCLCAVLYMKLKLELAWNATFWHHIKLYIELILSPRIRVPFPLIFVWKFIIPIRLRLCDYLCQSQMVRSDGFSSWFRTAITWHFSSD